MKNCCPYHKSSGMFCFLLKWGDGDVISVFFYLSCDLGGSGVFFFSTLVETLGPSGEPFALPGSLFEEITQSPHLCCIMGLSERPRTPDVPVRRRAEGIFDTRVNTDRVFALF